MEIRLHDDVATFAELSLPLLQADPVRHTTALTVLAGAQRADGPVELVRMITMHQGDELRGVALQSKGWSLIVSAVPTELAEDLADALLERDPDLIGASGPRPQVEAFAAAWQARTGRRRRNGMDQRLFALETLHPPTGVPGAPRVATLDDVDLVARWRDDFAEAALPDDWPRSDRDAVARLIRRGHGYLLWELGGEPVSMAVASAPVAGMSRIGPVWTPPEHRNRGFGSAATAAAARWALDAGAEHVVLYTDLANPVSNAIYPRIGFRPLFDAVEFTFGR
jgi:predicted GNAT family acetyltransferase